MTQHTCVRSPAMASSMLLLLLAVSCYSVSLSEGALCMPWDVAACHRKLSVYLLTKTSAGAIGMCIGFNRDLQNYVSDNCKASCVEHVTNNIVTPLNDAMDSVFCNPTKECSIKQKLDCHQAVYDTIGAGPVPALRGLINIFLDNVGPAMVRGFKDYCRKLPESDEFYGTWQTCMWNADQAIYRCLKPSNPIFAIQVRSLFDIMFLTVGPPASPLSGLELRMKKNELCRALKENPCDVDYHIAKLTTQTCVADYVRTFDGEDFPTQKKICLATRELMRCTGPMVKKCLPLFAFFEKATASVNTMATFCPRGRGLKGASTATTSTLSLLIVGLLVAKWLN